MMCALIMAGGKGTRFWPLSTTERPKQFLDLLGDKTMIQMTVDRLTRYIPINRIFIVTGKEYKALVREQLTMLPEENIILEPCGRNTAPCIALSAFAIRERYPDATLAVLPADHLIGDIEGFLQVLQACEDFVQEHDQAIVTIGMKPNRPETGYGYINYGEVASINHEQDVRKVRRFVEKPSLERAKAYLAEGDYLWNGGIFVWTIPHILQLTKAFLPKTYEIMEQVFSYPEAMRQEKLAKGYMDVDRVSVDYGIMEKAGNIFVIQGDFGWDDIGSWSAVERYRKGDASGSLILGEGYSIDGTNNLIVTKNSRVILDGLDNIYVVENDGNIIVGKRENVDRIKEVREKVGKL